MASNVYSLVQVNGLDRVNLTTADSQTLSDYVHFPSGGGLAVYTSDSNAVLARLLDAQGEPTGVELTIDATDANGGEATLLSNGNIVVTWNDVDDVRAAIYSQSLQVIKPSFVLFTGAPGKDYYNPEIAPTPDGGFVVSSTYTFGYTDYDIYTKKFDADGNASATESITPLSYDSTQSVAVAPNGDVLVTFTHYNTDTANYELWTALYNQSLGTTIKSESIAWNGNVGSLDTVANADGTFSAFFTSQIGSYEYLYRLVISSAGVAVGNPAAFFSPDQSSKPAVGFSPTGQQFILAPYLATPSSVGNDLRAFLRSPDGSTLVASFDAVALPGGQTNAQFGFLNPYTVQIVFTGNSSSPGTDGDGNTVLTGRYQIVNTTTGGTAPELLNGSAVIDVMLGLAGNDTMDGAAGPDTMRGGLGNDLYTVEEGGDLVDEQTVLSDGYDTVNSYISYTLTNNVEALALIGGAPIAAVDNALDNYLQGNGADNTLDGSFGADLMRGFGGNDSYVVDNAGDTVDEFTPGSDGWDTVYSYIDHKLTPNVEALVLLGTLKLDGAGNNLANFIQGNDKANGLKGGGGNDTIKGLGGKDTIDGGGGNGDLADYSDRGKGISVTLNGSNTVTVREGNSGQDKLKNVEGILGTAFKDNLAGDSKANLFDGGLGKDTIKGGGGNDWLNGSFGKDQLTGGDGKDKFVFSVALDASNADSITDFRHDQDKIALEDYLVGWFLGPKLEKAEFYAKGGANKAHDASDRIIYNTDNGNLYYDHDGKGGAAAVKFATLTNHPGTLDHGDFLIV